MADNIEVIVNAVALIFTGMIVIAIAFLLLTTLKFRKRRKVTLKPTNERVTLFKTVVEEQVEKELNKAMKAIDSIDILNEKQVNHAENHNDIKEVKRFENFSKKKTFNINQLGETVYGKY